MEDKFKQLIEGSDKILVTSHISPDPDAVASLLLMGTTLKTNFPDKKIKMVLEEKPIGLDFLVAYEQIDFEPISQAVESLQPDLFIIVDANTYGRASRQGQRLEESVVKSNATTAIIDHHEPDGRADSDIFINQGSIAAVQEIYELLFNQLKLKKPEGYAETTMLGLYSDSGGLAYANPRGAQTMKLAAELVEAGVNVEKIKNKINQYTDDQMRVVSRLTANAAGQSDYTYSFLEDEFVEDWVKSGKSLGELHSATKPFVDNYIRNIGGRQWGFIVYRDPLEGEGIYSVSLRSVGGVKDVSRIAKRLNGGGHKPAAGGKFEASSIESAINKVKAVILEP